jgi:hypothetical protein
LTKSKTKNYTKLSTFVIMRPGITRAAKSSLHLVHRFVSKAGDTVLVEEDVGLLLDSARLAAAETPFGQKVQHQYLVRGTNVRRNTAGIAVTTTVEADVVVRTDHLPNRPNNPPICHCSNPGD